MPTDFLDAHERHWQDAELLLDNQRWANADHLYGVSAECGLKHLLERQQGKPIQPNQRRHIREDAKPEDIWDIYQTYQSGRASGVQSALPLDNPFASWSISGRYAHRQDFDEQSIARHRQGALLVYRLVAHFNRDELQP